MTPNSASVYIPLTDVAAISGGAYHTCAVTKSGGAICWGDSSEFQLGNGSSSFVTSPVTVISLSRGVAAISAGGFHTCALTTAGGVRCWGDNDFGQLGDGTQDNLGTPVVVVGLTTGVTAISAGGDHTCALSNAGAVKCWGSNEYGQLGDSTTAAHTTPVDVGGLPSGAVAVSAGDDHTCAVTTTGAVKCWGSNLDGQLGDGSTAPNQTSPVDVVGLATGVMAISAGSGHTCALTTTGGVKCWGNNEAGQLGDGTQGNLGTPVDVVGLTTGVTAISAGGDHTCALSNAGAVKCWGDNFSGELGDGSTAVSNIPVDVIGLTGGVTAISTSDDHSCALTIGGGVKCWGDNFHAQLGDTTTIERALAGDVLVPAICYALTRTHTGDGANPAATPGNSPGCPPGHYLPGQVIVLAAAPNAGRFVQSWSGTNDNNLRDILNYLRMPAADTTVRVTYGVCRALTCAHSGAGDDPLAIPSHSLGCASGRYATGDLVTLIAAPGSDQRVQSWAGATQTPASGNLVNALTMPDDACTIAVAYEPCFQLTATTNGQGDPIAASPVAATGCAPGRYVAGQSIVLSAAPASGWTIANWSGTDDDDATAATNTLTMPSAATTVSITYVEGQTGSVLHLPLISK